MFVTKCGIDKEKIRFRQHLSTEMAHYANECWDLECETSFVRRSLSILRFKIYFNLKIFSKKTLRVGLNVLV